MCRTRAAQSDPSAIYPSTLSRCFLTPLFRSRNHLVALLFALFAASAPAQNILHINASTPAPKPRPVLARLGTTRALDGHTLTVNSRYLLLNGKPWLPVMGEFHYSRVPVRQWEPEILKMKAAGVQIISTYVLWNQQEEVQGRFDWSGRRNLRHFVRLCAKNGMYVYPRIGPWAHAEARNGGFPDWVLKRSPVRTNNPIYLAEVRSFYQQIGLQLKGLLWKDNGPVIGVQIENEYHKFGPGSGNAHIRKLKQIALQAGIDVPLYTVTGWDGAAIPRDQVLPVYGGYPTAPWDRHPGKLTPRDIFAFRFHNRAAGAMSAHGSHGQNSAAAYQGTPFLTAEIGGGAEDTYYRRPVIHPQDIASLAPVMLGSGANLLGYYMFQGGRNPRGILTTLQESQRTGYPTDVPVRSYDFQAPLGEFGQQRPTFRLLKLVNYFLQNFGSLLAPMTVAAPTEQPAGPADLSVPRASARVSGNHAFLFFNNYVRGAQMPARQGFQFQLHLPSEQLQIPGQPITLPTGAYGIWPVNLSLNGHNLIYSTAQLFTLAQSHGENLYFFFTIPGIPPQFAFAAGQHPRFNPHQVATTRRKGVLYLHCLPLASPIQITLPRSHSHPAVRIVLLSRSAAEDVWTIDGSPDLVSTPDQYYSHHATLHLLANGQPLFRFALLGPDTPSSLTPIHAAAHSLFRSYTLRVPPAKPALRVTFLRAARPRTLSPRQQKRPVPFAPTRKNFAHAAAWQLRISWPPAAHVRNVFLNIHYTGDVARLYSGSRLLDDNFWNGTTWQLGMQPWRKQIAGRPLRLLILPAPLHSTIGSTGNGTEALRHRAQLLHITVTPQYALKIPLRRNSPRTSTSAPGTAAP